MKPENFSQATRTLTRPREMTDQECGPLPIFNDGRESISCWKMSWKERISALVFGRVWLYVVAGPSQPPVALDVTRTVFIKERRTWKGFFSRSS